MKKIYLVLTILGALIIAGLAVYRLNLSNSGEASWLPMFIALISMYYIYVDKNADPYILGNYYHWFVAIPGPKNTQGFHTEAKFRKYIETLGIRGHNWQTPDEAYIKFEKTGCLEWFPDCN